MMQVNILATNDSIDTLYTYTNDCHFKRNTMIFFNIYYIIQVHITQELFPNIIQMRNMDLLLVVNRRSFMFLPKL